MPTLHCHLNAFVTKQFPLPGITLEGANPLAATGAVTLLLVLLLVTLSYLWDGTSDTQALTGRFLLAALPMLAVVVVLSATVW